LGKTQSPPRENSRSQVAVKPRAAAVVRFGGRGGDSLGEAAENGAGQKACQEVGQKVGQKVGEKPHQGTPGLGMRNLHSVISLETSVYRFTGRAVLAG
jgi:hypothetical protein